jgi:hypothetical protein
MNRIGRLMNHMISTRYLLILALLVGLVGAACSPATPEPELPTLAVLPTITPSRTPTDTPIPTWTPTETRTPTPTITRTPTPTVTLTPTLTVTSSITPTSTNTPTPTLTPSDTPTPTSTFTPTSSVPVISDLSVSPNEANVGDTVTLTWDAEGDQTTLQIQNQFGNTVSQVNLPPRGSQQVVIPDSIRTLAVFRLNVTRGGLTESRSVAVDLGCDGLFFFAAGRIDGSICPEGQPSTSTGRYQPFQRGTMLWIPQKDRVYFLYSGSQNGLFSRLEQQTLTGTLPVQPSGQFLPEEEFAGVWLQTFSPNGNTWESEIGYGTQNAQQFTFTIQEVEGSTAFFVGIDSLFLYLIQPSPGSLDTGTWALIP